LDFTVVVHEGDHQWMSLEAFLLGGLHRFSGEDAHCDPAALIGREVLPHLGSLPGVVVRREHVSSPSRKEREPGLADRWDAGRAVAVGLDLPLEQARLVRDEIADLDSVRLLWGDDEVAESTVGRHELSSFRNG